MKVKPPSLDTSTLTALVFDTDDLVGDKKYAYSRLLPKPETATINDRSNRTTTLSERLNLLPVNVIKDPPLDLPDDGVMENAEYGETSMVLPDTQTYPSLLTSTVTLPDTSPGTTQSIWDVERHTAATGNPSPNLHDNSRDATKPEPRTVKRKPPSPDATLGNVFRTDGRG